MKYMRKLHPFLDILVSSIGEVFVPRGHNVPAHWTFGCKHHTGYRTVRIDGKDYPVHRLVAETFIPNPENKPQVDHISRQKDQNFVDNLRWATPSQNSRNRADHDRVTEQGRTHKYEDARQADREYRARYRAEHPEKLRERRAHHYAENSEKVREQNARYNQSKRKTHRVVHFADGSSHWVSLAEAEAYLIIPLKERNYAK